MSTLDHSASPAYPPGQRLCLASQECTVRYIGAVKNKTGEWLGVEWDNPLRGRNNGSHDGVKYFECKSSSPTAASFIRPSQAWDKARTFLDALADKYFRVEEARSEEVLFVSRSKQYEEVGFEKFALRQAQLKGIHVLILDHMRIGPDLPDGDAERIAGICSNITDLDLGSNLFEKLDDILELCSALPKLNSLTLDGNRLQIDHTEAYHKKLENVRSLSLNNILLTEDELSHLLTAFPGIKQLELARNNISAWSQSALPDTIDTVTLSDNSLESLAAISGILKLLALRTLKLKDNQIKQIAPGGAHLWSTTLTELDLGRNAIGDWAVIDQLPTAFPALRSLRVSGNPIYSALKSVKGKPLLAEDGYMLTIARLPLVNTLNFSTINDKDRLNAEKYYLNEIATELSLADVVDAPSIIARHPRWRALCEEYGEPEIDRAKPDDINPDSLEARLLTVDYYVASKKLSGSIEVPRAWSIYALYGLIAKQLDVMPVSFRLIWETDERDPVSQNDNYNGPEWWDSDDDEDVTGELSWTMRSVLLSPGTRSTGTYCEGRRATIRIELVG